MDKFTQIVELYAKHDHNYQEESKEIQTKRPTICTKFEHICEFFQQISSDNQRQIRSLLNLDNADKIIKNDSEELVKLIQTLRKECPYLVIMMSSNKKIKDIIKQLDGVEYAPVPVCLDRLSNFQIVEIFWRQI